MKLRLPFFKGVCSPGIEVFASFQTDFNSTDFLIDSNALEIRRKQKNNSTDNPMFNMAKSLYPVTSLIAINDTSGNYFVLQNDRS